LKAESTFVSPVSVLYFEHYSNVSDLQKKIEGHQDKIQCVVSAQRWFTGSEAFGQAQFPDVTDYADKADTLKFLAEITKNA
jgi:hypothetical protein